MSLFLKRLERLGFNQPIDTFFQNLLSEQVWDSQFHWYQHLFSLLSLQRSVGDPYLSRFDGSPGNGFVDHFTIFHLYRHSGRSHCQRLRTGCCRAATNIEIHTHGRWCMVNRGRLSSLPHEGVVIDIDNISSKLRCNVAVWVLYPLKSREI